MHVICVVIYSHTGPNRFAYLKDGDPSETKAEIAPGSVSTQELHIDVKSLSEIKINVADSSAPVRTPSAAAASASSASGLGLLALGGPPSSNTNNNGAFVSQQSPSGVRAIGAPGTDIKSQEVVKFAPRDVDEEGKEKVDAHTATMPVIDYML